MSLMVCTLHELGGEFFIVGELGEEELKTYILCLGSRYLLKEYLEAIRDFRI